MQSFDASIVEIEKEIAELNRRIEAGEYRSGIERQQMIALASNLGVELQEVKTAKKQAEQQQSASDQKKALAAAWQALQPEGQAAVAAFLDARASFQEAVDRLLAVDQRCRVEAQRPLLSSRFALRTALSVDLRAVENGVWNVLPRSC
jgi:predicted RNA-binding protein with EMAP domain